MSPLLASVFQGRLLCDAAMNSTNETNKAWGMRHSSVYITSMSMG